MGKSTCVFLFVRSAPVWNMSGPPSRRSGCLTSPARPRGLLVRWPDGRTLPQHRMHFSAQQHNKHASTLHCPTTHTSACPTSATLSKALLPRQTLRHRPANHHQSTASAVLQSVPAKSSPKPSVSSAERDAWTQPLVCWTVRWMKSRTTMSSTTGKHSGQSSLPILDGREALKDMAGTLNSLRETHPPTTSPREGGLGTFDQPSALLSSSFLSSVRSTLCSNTYLA